MLCKHAYRLQHTSSATRTTCKPIYIRLANRIDPTAVLLAAAAEWGNSSSLGLNVTPAHYIAHYIGCSSLGFIVRFRQSGSAQTVGVLEVGAGYCWASPDIHPPIFQFCTFPLSLRCALSLDAVPASIFIPFVCWCVVFIFIVSYVGPAGFSSFQVCVHGRH